MQLLHHQFREQTAILCIQRGELVISKSTLVTGTIRSKLNCFHITYCIYLCVIRYTAHRRTDESRCLMKFTKKQPVSLNQAESFIRKSYQENYISHKNTNLHMMLNIIFYLKDSSRKTCIYITTVLLNIKENPKLKKSVFSLSFYNDTCQCLNAVRALLEIQMFLFSGHGSLIPWNKTQILMFSTAANVCLGLVDSYVRTLCIDGNIVGQTSNMLFILLNPCFFSLLLFTLPKLCLFSLLLLFHSSESTFILCIAHLAHCAHHLKGNPAPGDSVGVLLLALSWTVFYYWAFAR